MSIIEICIWIGFIILVSYLFWPPDIIRMFRKNDNTVGYDPFTDTFETLESLKRSVRESKQHTTDEVEVNCSKCGAPNKKLDAYCGYCGSTLYIEKTVKVKPFQIKSVMIRE
jgi:hypothetical protein